MPIKNATNNRILPANARASDVASKAIKEIVPVQQQRNMSAHRVQGFQAVHYSHLNQGRKCNCKSSEAKLNTRLGNDGKANPGLVNELITGAMTFNVSPYGSSPLSRDDPFDSRTSPLANDKFQGVFDNIGKQPDSLPTRIQDGVAFGDNGPQQEYDIEEYLGDWDSGDVGITDAACAICFGTGFVGGYAPFHSQRIVLTVDEVDLGLATINALLKPWTSTGPGFSAQVVFPFGAIGVDSFKVYNQRKAVGANFTVDGQAVDAISILRFCDGRPHTLAATFFEPEVTWTHMEMQFALSKESAFFEFPKLNQSSDTNLLEKTEPFQIIVASNLPSLKAEDIIIESIYGKALIVQTVNWWNDRDRNILGWECQVRPIQPQELYNILPRRGRLMSKPPTSLGVHDNMRGTYRT